MKSNWINRAIKKIAAIGLLKNIPDEVYLKLLFWAMMERKLDLNNPVTYNEKLQWLKLNDRNPEYIALVDKNEAKKFVQDMVGKQYIIPTLGVWKNAEDIDFSLLPNKFVLKCTHNSGGVVVCKDKSKLDITKTIDKLNKSLRENYYYWGREWPYKNVVPQIIAEEYIGEGDVLPEDYKFYTFNGEVDSVMICMEREQGYPKFIFYDQNWNRLYYQNHEPDVQLEREKPKNFDEMLEIVKKLSQGRSQLRVDLYNVEGKIYFGELTFYNQSGFDTDITNATDLYWGNKIVLP